jgi:predicted site-specific integrase-resolvase
MYTTRSIAEIFEVSVRAIQNWIAVGQLTARNLPGRWRFLTQDVEDFLQASQKGAR